MRPVGSSPSRAHAFDVSVDHRGSVPASHVAAPIRVSQPGRASAVAVDADVEHPSEWLCSSEARNVADDAAARTEEVRRANHSDAKR